MENKDVVFKTAAVGGFEKRAVLDYIYKMNEDMENERTGLVQQIEDAKFAENFDDSALKDIQEEKRVLQNKIDNLTQELTNEKSKNRELAEKVERLKIEKNSIVNNDRLRELEEKQEEIEKSSYQIGRVMLDARTDADKIVEGAKLQADKIVNQAQTTASEHKINIEKEASELLESTKATTKEQLDNASAESQQIIADSNKNAQDIKLGAHNESEGILNSAKTKLAEIINTSRQTSVNSSNNLGKIEENLARIIAVAENSFNDLKQQSSKIQDVIIKAKEAIGSEQKNIEGIDTTKLSLDAILQQYQLPVSTENEEIYSYDFVQEESVSPEPKVVQDFFTPQEQHANVVEESTPVITETIAEEYAEVRENIDYDSSLLETIEEKTQEKAEELKSVFQEPIAIFGEEKKDDVDSEVGRETGLLEKQ